MTIFVDVPNDVVRQQDDANLNRVLAKPNKVHVLVSKREISGATDAAGIHLLPEVTIQGGKHVYINLETPMKSLAFTKLNTFINLIVRVGGAGTPWRDLGNTNFRLPIVPVRSNTWHRHTLSMHLDFITDGIVPTNADYKLYFGIVLVPSVSAVATVINGGCDINATGVGGRGNRLYSVTDQNFFRLIVQEVD